MATNNENTASKYAEPRRTLREYTDMARDLRRTILCKVFHDAKLSDTKAQIWGTADIAYDTARKGHFPLMSALLNCPNQPPSSLFGLHCTVDDLLVEARKTLERHY